MHDEQVQYQLVDESIHKSVERFTKSNNSKTIAPKALREKINGNNSFHLIDVREADEYNDFNIGGVNIPLQTFLQTQELLYLIL